MSQARLFSTNPNFRQFITKKINVYIADSYEKGVSPENNPRISVAEYYLWTYIKDPSVDEINLLQNVCKHIFHGLDSMKKVDHYNKFDELRKFLCVAMCEYLNIPLDGDFVVMANQMPVRDFLAMANQRVVNDIVAVANQRAVSDIANNFSKSLEANPSILRAKL